jgi:hypothetical protein
VLRLDDASWSFFIFFSQDNIFMASYVGRDCGGVCGSGTGARQLIKCWATTAQAGPRAFAINTGAEAQTSSR